MDELERVDLLRYAEWESRREKMNLYLLLLTAKIPNMMRANQILQEIEALFNPAKEQEALKGLLIKESEMKEMLETKFDVYNKEGEVVIKISEDESNAPKAGHDKHTGSNIREHSYRETKPS